MKSMIEIHFSISICESIIDEFVSLAFISST